MERPAVVRTLQYVSDIGGSERSAERLALVPARLQRLRLRRPCRPDESELFQRHRQPAVAARSARRAEVQLRPSGRRRRLVLRDAAAAGRACRRAARRHHDDDGGRHRCTNTLPQLQRGGRHQRLAPAPASLGRRVPPERPGHAPQHAVRFRRGPGLAERRRLRLLPRPRRCVQAGRRGAAVLGLLLAGSRPAARRRPAVSRCPHADRRRREPGDDRFRGLRTRLRAHARIPDQRTAGAGRRRRSAEPRARCLRAAGTAGHRSDLHRLAGVLHRGLPGADQSCPGDRRPALRGDGPRTCQPERGAGGRGGRLRARVPVVELARRRRRGPAQRRGRLRAAQQREGSGRRQHLSGQRQPGLRPDRCPAVGGRPEGGSRRRTHPVDRCLVRHRAGRRAGAVRPRQRDDHRRHRLARA